MDHLESFEPKKFFETFWIIHKFWSILGDFAYFEPKYLQNGLIWRSLVFCVYFVSILSHFWPSFVKIFQVVGEKMPKNHSKMPKKIGHFEVKFSTWRRQVGKNMMRQRGKRIYRRYRISNQIFGSIYWSQDIARSLDNTTFAAIFS